MVTPKRSWSLCKMTGSTGFPCSFMTGNGWIKQKFQAFQEINGFILADRLQNLSLQMFSQSWGVNEDVCSGTLMIQSPLKWSGDDLEYEHC